jgi:hypothetical protein
MKSSTTAKQDKNNVVEKNQTKRLKKTEKTEETKNKEKKDNPPTLRVTNQRYSLRLTKRRSTSSTNWTRKKTRIAIVKKFLERIWMTLTLSKIHKGTQRNGSFQIWIRNLRLTSVMDASLRSKATQSTPTATQYSFGNLGKW